MVPIWLFVGTDLVSTVAGAIQGLGLPVVWPLSTCAKDSGFKPLIACAHLEIYFSRAVGSLASRRVLQLSRRLGFEFQLEPLDSIVQRL